MAFFNIILNITVHIHQKKKKSHITHPIFMKTHPCHYLHDKKHFVLEDVFQIM